MKKSNKFVLIGTAVIVAWGYYATETTGDQVWMEQNIRKAGQYAVCTKTENVENHTWLACRWGDGTHDQGPVWALDNSGDEKAWIAANGKAKQFLDRINRVAPDWQETTFANMRMPAPSDDLPFIIPWEKLN